MMTKSFRELVGIPPSTASTDDSVLIIIDAQNEYENPLRSLICLNGVTLSYINRTSICADLSVADMSIMIYRYATGHLKTEKVDMTRVAIFNLLEKYRTAQAPIVHIVHVTPEGAPVFTPNSDMAKEFAELEPNVGEKVIGKRFISSFVGTDLDDYLKSTGKNKVVLTGYMSHVCVSSTARSASDLGYEVLVAQDGVGDRDIPGASAAQVVATVMAELGDSFGTIINSTDVK
jgi:nicotinamidase-related amidase